MKMVLTIQLEALEKDGATVRMTDAYLDISGKEFPVNVGRPGKGRIYLTLEDAVEYTIDFELEHTYEIDLEGV